MARRTGAYFKLSARAPLGVMGYSTACLLKNVAVIASGTGTLRVHALGPNEFVILDLA